MVLALSRGGGVAGASSNVLKAGRKEETGTIEGRGVRRVGRVHRAGNLIGWLH